jgi:hypothetical protein
MFEQFRRDVQDYCVARGHMSGFPTFEDQTIPHVDLTSLVMVRQSSGAFFRDIPKSDLGVELESNDALYRAVCDWAVAHNLDGGFPTCHQADYGNGVVYGAILFPKGSIAWTDVPRAEFPGTPPRWNLVGMFRGAQVAARNRGYAAGIPTFHEADYGSGLVYGVQLLPAANVEIRAVPKPALTMKDRFAWSGGASPDQQQRVLDRHAFAWEQVAKHPPYDAVAAQIYQQALDHGNAGWETLVSTSVTGTAPKLLLNLQRLLDLDPTEISQLLFHCVTHLVGWTHGERQLPPDPATDSYYQSGTLKSEGVVGTGFTDTVCTRDAAIGFAPYAIITKVDYDPPGADLAGEYVEIVNPSLYRARSMAGWTLGDEDRHTYTFPAGVTLPARGTLRVWTKTGNDTASDLYMGRGAAIWTNTGDTATLRNQYGGVVATYKYPR